LLVGILAFALPQLWLTLMVEARRAEWRDPEFFHRRKNLVALTKWSAESGRHRPLVVVLGTSRTAMGVSPKDLGLGDGPADPLACNCSQTGCMPVGQALNLGRLLDAGLKPEFVLIEVLPPVLADPRPVEDQLLPARLGTADLARLRPYAANPAALAARWTGSRLAAWYTYRFRLLEQAGFGDLVPPSVRDDFLWKDLPADGWGPFQPPVWSPADRARQVENARRQYAALLDNFRLNPGTARVHRDLLTDCRARGIRAALYLMPESPTFRGWYPESARAASRDYLAGLSAEFGVPVFDATVWIDDEAAFMDGHHLFRTGAVEFSRRFGRECVGPWVRAGRG
jgi:hypothetical protein